MCDLADDCGDNSDESLQLCEARSSSQSSEDETYFRDTFEEENESFFHNANNQETNWVRGSGDQLLKARSPAFDHTLFSDHGKFYFSHRPNSPTLECVNKKNFCYSFEQKSFLMTQLTKYRSCFSMVFLREMADFQSCFFVKLQYGSSNPRKITKNSLIKEFIHSTI